MLQDTSFPLHVPGPPRQKLSTFDVTSRCSESGSPFGHHLLVGEPLPAYAVIPRSSRAFP